MTFNAEDFLSQSVEGPMSTRIAPVPEGEYEATIGSEQNDVSVEMIQGRKDPAKQYPRLTLLWKIRNQPINQELGRDEITVRDQFLLDVNADGQLDTGPDRNVYLGSRREAVGLNDGAFSPAQFRGAGPALIRVTHRSNDKDPSIKYAEVSRVVPLR